MAGFNENVAVVEEWVPRNRSPGTLIGQENSFKEDTTGLYNKDNVLRGGLSNRIAARAGFNTPRLNTENIRSDPNFSSINSSLRSTSLTISSPGLSPTTLLESPVFLFNPMAQPSPTTGKFPFLPGVNSNVMSSDKGKDQFFDDNGASSFTFRPVSRSSSSFFEGTTEMMLADYGNFTNRSSHQSAEEGLKPGSQKTESSDLYGIETDPRCQNKESDAIANTGLESVNHQEEEEDQRHGDLMVGGVPGEDGYNWRKYGQKAVKGSEYPRSYYKCTDLNCEVKKKVERSREGDITEIIYKGSHNHSKSPPNDRSGIQTSGVEQVEQQQIHQQRQRDSFATWASCNSRQQQGGSNESNVEEGSNGFEYGNQSGLIQTQTGQFESGDTVVDASSTLTFSNDETEDDRGNHGSVSLGGGEVGEGDEPESKRRKLEAYAAEMSGATTRAIREPRIVVQTISDVDILDDGYRWRKYGQKVVKGNPNPRSYYKCTSTGCTVRKHVERASHDLQAVITTYEGKHNHNVPTARNSSHGSNGSNGTEPSRGRFDRQVTTTDQSPFGLPFSFQPHLDPPSGYSFGMNQTSLPNLSMPGLAFGQGKLPGLAHPYLTQPVGMNGAIMQRGMDSMVEPVSDSRHSVYNQNISELP